MKLRDKVAIITGGASGIGMATVLLFVREGARVIIADIQDVRGKVEDLLRKGDRVHFIPTDVSQEAQVKSLFQTAIRLFGRFHLLVNNAGIALPKTVPQTTEAEWDHLMGVNLKGVFLCSKEAICFFRQWGGGVIVNVASELGLVGGSEIAAYCASKGGVVQLTKAMAIDHAREGIRVNCVCPGPVETPLLDNLIFSAKDPEEERSRSLNSVPLGRFGRPEEIAKVILFLASEDSSFMTGAAVAVDGGWSAR
ncbi:MAG: glucose 1-dehydrogenase [Caldiserica bacterium]|nr:glucose 1-dehydrogenase [Caldisericota bacterium]MDH7563221.1 glucose 1-dehydrogenase [Caldisericota bacterium]